MVEVTFSLPPRVARQTVAEDEKTRRASVSVIWGRENKRLVLTENQFNFRGIKSLPRLGAFSALYPSLARRGYLPWQWKIFSFKAQSPSAKRPNVASDCKIVPGDGDDRQNPSGQTGHKGRRRRPLSEPDTLLALIHLRPYGSTQAPVSRSTITGTEALLYFSSTIHSVRRTSPGGEGFCRIPKEARRFALKR